MIGDLIAASAEAQHDITIVLHADSAKLSSWYGTYGTYATLLSLVSVQSQPEIWIARDPGIYASAWQTLCNASDDVVGS